MNSAKLLIAKTLGLAACACVGMGIAAGAASAQAKIQVGTLTCKGGGGVGLVVASQKTFHCRYTAEGKRTTANFTATMTRIGVDVGVTGDTTIVWGVLASGNTLAPSAIAGEYAGASADASIAVGGGANVLVGGSNKGISLQPLSIQGQEGVNLAVGVSSLNLRLER